jgi:hypothetical protein
VARILPAETKPSTLPSTSVISIFQPMTGSPRLTAPIRGGAVLVWVNSCNPNVRYWRKADIGQVGVE